MVDQQSDVSNLDKVNFTDYTSVAIDTLLDQGCALWYLSEAESIEDYKRRIRPSLAWAFRSVRSTTRTVPNQGVSSNGFFVKTVRSAPDRINWTLRSYIKANDLNDLSNLSQKWTLAVVAKHTHIDVRGYLDPDPKWLAYETSWAQIDVDTERVFSDIRIEFASENQTVKTINPAYSTAGYTNLYRSNEPKRVPIDDSSTLEVVED